MRTPDYPFYRKAPAPDLNRRDFARSLIGGTLGLTFLGCSREKPDTEDSALRNGGFFPALGVQTGINNAQAVKDAGGQWIGLSVAGFLEPDGPEQEFEQRLAELQAAPLPVLCCNSFIRRKDLHCTGPEANHDAVMEYVERAFMRAKRAGVSKITFGSGGSRQLPEGFPYEKGVDQFIALLTTMGPVAAKYGIFVGVEQLRSKECNFINRIQEVERVVRGANHPNICAIADFYHMAAEGDTPEQLASCAPLISHVELAELEGRRMPGTSGQDFRPFLKVLKEAQYRGAIGVEGKWEVSELPMGFAEITRQWNEA